LNTEFSTSKCPPDIGNSVINIRYFYIWLIDKMSVPDRSFILVFAFAAAFTTGCGSGQAHVEPASTQADRIERALASGGRYLIAQQAGDGAWRSDHYGALKDGASLSPLVLQALRALPASPERDDAYRRGLAYLASFVKPDGTIDPGPYGFNQPVHTSAGAVLLFSAENTASGRKMRDAWLAYLRERQLTEALGWQPADKEYGGWGYCPTLPRKPPAGQLTPPLTESNLSATLAALAALRAAGISSDDPVIQKAKSFVERCQNFGEEQPFDDGGFFFIYDDGVRNKAGIAGRDRQGRERYFSYGSMTADGLRALLLCGLPANQRRVVAARQWLEKRFSPTQHSGDYRPEREANREAVYYYYTCSAARALGELGSDEAVASARTFQWREALAQELVKRQRSDGSWANVAALVREDDPLIATSFAIRALVECKPGS
jgi:squalene-hopene/tetraprenyl-beta-curcumene cyclase